MVREMNSVQFSGIIIFCIGLLLYAVGTISVFFAGKTFMPILFSVGTLLLTLAIVVILISLVIERIKDFKKDKKMFSKMEGRK